MVANGGWRVIASRLRWLEHRLACGGACPSFNADGHDRHSLAHDWRNAERIGFVGRGFGGLVLFQPDDRSYRLSLGNHAWASMQQASWRQLARACLDHHVRDRVDN